MKWEPDIKSDAKEFKEIAELYHCDSATISRINRGTTKSYRLENYTYPLR